MNLGDTIDYANRKLLSEEDKALFNRIIKESRKDRHMQMAYKAYANIPNAKFKNPLIAENYILALTDNFDSKTYIEKSRMLSEGIEITESNDMNNHIHNVLSMPKDSLEYSKSFDYLMENMLADNEDDSETADYEGNVDDADAEFLGELSILDENGKKEKFNLLKEEVNKDIWQNIKESDSKEELIDLKECVVSVANMKYSLENMFKLYELSK